MQNLHLQEGIRDAPDVVFWAVAGSHKRLEVLDKKRDRLIQKSSRVQRKSHDTDTEDEPF